MPLALLRLMLGVFCCSTAVIFIKLSKVDAVLLAGLRLVIAAALLSPLMLRAQLRHRATFGYAWLGRALLPAAALAVHFVLWNLGARATLAANASLIVNLVPLVLPLILVPIAQERLRAPEGWGILIGMSGVILLSVADVRADPAQLRGDLTCFGAMLLFSLYLALGRKNRDIPSLFLYIVPLYAMAGVACLLVRASRWSSLLNLPLEQWVWVLALSLIPTILGHSLLNHALKSLRGATVSLWNLGQAVFGGALGWLVFREIPSLVIVPASLLILGGALLSLRGPASWRQSSGSGA